MKLYFLPLFLFALLLQVSAQQTNVIGATSQRFPESELDHQSVFIDANQKFLLGDFVKAQEILEKYIYDHADNDAAHYLLARTHLMQKEYNNALISAQKAIKADPKNKWYYQLQADIYEATARPKDAIATYDLMTKTFSATPEYYDKLSFLYTSAGEPTKALEVLDRWEVLTGLSEEIADKRHIIRIAMKDDKGAIDAYKKLIALYPGETAYLHKLARYYRETNRTDKASEVFQQILAINPNDPDARIGAVSRSDKSNGNDFLAKIKPLLADPTINIDGKITELMPFLKQMQKENDQTQKETMRAAALDLTVTHPNEAKAWSFAGDVFYLTSDNDQALKLYMKCISLQPEVYSVWQNTFDILAEKGDYTTLLTQSEKGMDAFPNQPKSFYYYGVAANQLNKPNDGLPQLQQALIMAGNNTQFRLDIQAQIGLTYIKQNKADKAIEYLEAILPKGGSMHPEVLEYLGDAYQAKGNTTKAREMWQAAQKINPSARLQSKIG